MQLGWMEKDYCKLLIIPRRLPEHPPPSNPLFNVVRTFSAYSKAR